MYDAVWLLPLRLYYTPKIAWAFWSRGSKVGSALRFGWALSVLKT